MCWEAMVLCECVADPGILLLPCLLILLYLGGVVVSIVNTAECFQKRTNVYSSELIAAHLAFSIIGCVTFFCVSSVLWLWSSKYAFTHAERMWRMCVGLWFMCFLKDLPLLIVETHAYLQVGWQNGTFMDASFILQIIFFVPSALVSSTTISWYVAGFLERQFGDAVMVSLQEKEVPPPLSPEVSMQLATASVRPPPLPMHEMQYAITATASPFPPSISRSPYYSSNAGEKPISYVSADYSAGHDANPCIVHLPLASNDLRAIADKEGVGPHPSVI